MRELRVEGARDLGAQFVGNSHRMVGQDGAYSIPLAPGRALWFFGDTLVGERVPGESLWSPGGIQLGPGDMSGHGSIEKLFNNTALILEQESGRDGLTGYRYVCDNCGALKQLIPRGPDEHPDEFRVWCFHGLAAGEKLCLYYQVVRMLAEGPMPVNFELVGSGLAEGDSRTWDFSRIPNGDTTIWWPPDQPQFGCVALRGRGDGWVYVFGVLKNAGGVQQCHLARVREAEIARLDAYEYFTAGSPAWSADARKAIPIMDGMPNEMSVSWSQHLGCYLAVHSLDLTGIVVGRTAPDPWGPWSDPVALWRVEPPKWDYAVPYPALIYAGKEHPELAGNGGRVIYLTYIEFEEYYPHLVEVSLA